MRTPVSEAWKTMGEVLDDLAAVDSEEAASEFLAVALKVMGRSNCNGNLRYAFARYIPEMVGQDGADRIELLIRRAGWMG